jgi:hypothetical protein
MKLRELKTEIEESAKSPVEKAYPITSDWIPVTDALAIIDRFEKEWRREFETARWSGSKAESFSPREFENNVLRIIANLLA